MKYISLFLLLFILTINLNKSFAEDALTLKQQLDRVMEEVKDLNKAVFNKSFDNEKLYSLDESIDAERFTSIDIRIYDLEKDIIVIKGNVRLKKNENVMVGESLILNLNTGLSKMSGSKNNNKVKMKYNTKNK